MTFKHFLKKSCAVLLAVLTVVSMMTVMIVEKPLVADATASTSFSDTTGAVTATVYTYTRNGPNASFVNNSTSTRLEAHSGPDYSNNSDWYGRVMFKITGTPSAITVDGTSYSFKSWGQLTLGGTAVNTLTSVGETIPSLHYTGDNVISKLTLKAVMTGDNALGTGSGLGTTHGNWEIYAIAKGYGYEGRTLVFKSTATFVSSSGATTTKTYTWNVRYYVQNGRSDSGDEYDLSTKYTVTYDANTNQGGVASTAPSSQTKYKDLSLTLTSAVPTGAFGDFLYWNTKQDGSGTTYASGASYTANESITLYAQYDVESYSVYYYSNYPSGTNSLLLTESAPALSTYTVPSYTPAYSGYAFKGWASSKTATSAAYTAGDTWTMPAMNISVYAVWEKTTTTLPVMYFPNYPDGSSNSYLSSTNYGVGETVTVSTLTPSFDGYIFKGWHLADPSTSSGNDQTLEVNAVAGDTFVKAANGPAMLRAVWELDTSNLAKYTVVYINNYGITPDPQTKVEGIDLTLEATPTGPSGFTGWNTKADGTGTSYAAGATYSTDADLTLYAVYYGAAQYYNNYPGATQSVFTTSSGIRGAEATIVSTAPTYDGYKFLGWATSSTATEAQYVAGDTFTLGGVAPPTYFYAVWRTLNTYTVTYDANGGSGAPSAQTKTEDTALTLNSTVPTRTGYTFKGWGTSSTDTTVDYAAGASYTANADITLYAIWEPITYTVSYNANGGSGAPSAQTKTYGVALTLSSTKPARTGYTFQGWGSSTTDTSVDYAVGATYTANASTTLYAIWKINTYPVTYNANGGSGAPAQQTKTYGTDLTLSSTEPTRTGYTFTGWNTAANGSGTAYAKGAEYTTNAALTLYAQWSANTYTLTYNANGGSNPPAAQSGKYGNSLTISSTAPTRTGYTFKGWATSASSTTVTYEGGDSFVIPASNTTVYAVWQINSYTLTYNANGGSGAPTAQSGNYGTTLTISSTVPTRTGYTFKGWATSASSTAVAYEGGDSFTIPASNTTIYAVWSIDSYTLTYNANGGTGAPAQQSGNYNTTLTISSTVPTRTGYTFQGWGASSTATSVAYEGGDTFTIPASNTTIYAIWKINTYTVAYNANGGSGAPASQTKTYGTDLTLSTATPTRAGYGFIGWNTKADGSGTAYASGAKYTTNANLTLYAQWSADSYTVTYNANGGSNAPSAQTKTHDVALTLTSSKPTYTGYTFKNWNTKADGSGTAYASAASYTTNASVTLYAQWAPVSYTITYNLNGGTNNASNPGTYTIEDSVTYKDPTRTGYSFGGWYKESSFTTKTTGIAEGSTGNVTVYAKWIADTYTITYNANGGSNAPSAQTKTHDIALTLSTTKPTRTGYTFTGWDTKSDGSGTDYASGANYTANASITLYAQWTINTYTLTYDANGGSTSSVPEAQTGNYNTKVTVSETVPTYTNYKFLGWSESKAATSATYSAGDEITLTKNVTLYAVWIRTYNVRYFNSVTGGSFNWLDQVKVHDEAVTVQKYNDYWWTTNADGTGDKYYPGDEYTINADINLYAVLPVYLRYETNAPDGTEKNFLSVTVPNRIATTITSSEPTVTGYTFKGWAQADSSDNDQSVSVTHKTGDSFTPNWKTYADGSDFYFLAVWEINNYKLNYNANGGSGAPASQSGNYNTTLTISSTKPIKSGYTFKGWDTDSSADTVVYEGSDTFTIPANDTTLYAVWELNKYTVTYKENGGNASSLPASQTKTHGTDLTLSTTVPTRTGYGFTGWNTVANGSGTAYASGAEYTTDANLTLYAQWKADTYPVTYYGNADGVTNVPSAQSKTHDVKLTLSSNIPARTGYTFAGWNTKNDGSGTDYAKGAEYTSNAALNLYAQWTINSYNIVYYVDGTEYKTETYNYGAKVTALAEPTKTGYTFSGWSEIPATMPANDVEVKGTFTINSYTITYISDGETYKTATYNYNADIADVTNPTKTGYTFTGWSPEVPEKMPANDVTVTAQWTANNYVVKFDKNATDATGTMADQTFEYNVAQNLTANAFKRTGYTFKGWSTSKTATAATYTDKQSVKNLTSTANGTITLYAVWSINSYKLIYSVDGVTGTPATQTGNYNTKLTVSTIKPTKIGYTFLGWDTDSSADTVVYESGDSFTVPASDTTIYAIWKANPYTLSYDANGGTGAPASQTGDCDSTLTISETKPTLKGHTFLGWAESKTATEVEYVGGDDFTVPAKNTTLYAVWKVNEYTITFDENGGTEVPDLTLDYGEDVLDVTPPTKDGYTFDDWTPALPDTMPDEDITVTAQWTANSYIVKFDGNGSTSGAMSEQSFTYDVKQALAENKFAKTGHTFLGWATSEDVSEAVYTDKQEVINLTKTDGGVVTLYAVWEVNSYTLSYNANGGENAPATQTGNYGSKLTVSSDEPVKTGYTFKGWSESASSATVAYEGGDSFTVPAKNTVLYAVWTANPYKLVYDANGGENAPAAQTANYATTITVSSDEPTREGYTFLGWSENNKATSADEAYKGGSSYVVPAHDTTVYAVWKINSYTITYKVNGEDYDSQTYEYGAKVTPITEPTKVGYTFSGWDNVPETMPANNVTVSGDFTINTYKITYVVGVPILNEDSKYTYTTHYTTTYEYGEKITTLAKATKDGFTFLGWDEIPETMPANDVTVTGLFKRNTYTVHYDTDGGNEITPTDVLFEDEIPGVEDPTKDGYTFEGWDKEIPETMPNEDIEVTAQWNANEYEVKYNANADNATGTMENSKHVYDVAKNLNDNKFNRVGYTFEGWALETDSDTVAYTDEQSVINLTTVDGDVVDVYAVWKPIEYDIVYILGGGTNNVDNPEKFTIEETVTFEDPTKEHYAFGGWYSDADFTDKVTEIPEGTSGKQTVYAKWTPVEYDIVYILNGGTNNANNPDTYTVEDEFDFADATRNGYTFDGWFESDAKVTEIEGIEKGTFDTVTVYAQWTAIPYDIIYNVDGGENNPLNPDEYTIEDEVKLEEPTKEGYDFDGWFSDSDLTNPIDTIPEGSTGDIEVYAKWTPTIYNITYVMNGGINNSKNPATYTIESEDITFADPTFFAHDFHGWLDSNGDKITGIPSGSMGDITVYADWKLHDYTITYVLNGGVNDSRNVPMYNYGDTVTLYDATRTGYEFIGWHEAEDFSDNVITEFDEKTSGDKTVYAEWKVVNYDITYNLNGGVNHKDNPETYTVEDEVSYSDASRDYYDFDGWYLDEEFKAPTTGIKAGSTGAVEIFAKWTPVEYVITYVLDGGKNSDSNPNYYNVEDEVSFSDATREHYIFDGWYSDSEFKNEVTGIKVGSHGEKTVYAKWTPVEYDIVYVMNGGINAASNPAKYTVEDEITFADASRHGYTFDGWFESNDKLTEIEGIPVGTHGTITVYAQWTAIPYDIVYNVNGGTNNPENPVTYTIEDEVKFEDPTREGYDFDGWFEDEDFNTPISGIDKGTTGETEVYAKWTPIVYNITYVMNGGVNNSANPATYTIESADITFAEPTYRGYDFFGWVDSNGNTVTGIKSGSIGDVTVYANWNLHDYTITYNLDGGENDGRNIPFYKLGDTVVLYPATKLGYTFIGWHEAEDLSDEIITGYDSNTVGDKVVYAEWKLDDYNINYHLNGGENSAENPETYTVHDTVSYSDATREHYTFEGWYSDEALTVQTTGIPEGTTGNVDVYAKWNDIYYDVNYNLGGGENDITNPSKVTYFDVVELKAPTKNGYEFLGWTDENGNEVTVLENIEAPITLTANWKAVVYKITYVYNGGYTQSKNPTTYTIEDDVDLYGCYKPGDYVFYYWMTEDGEKVMHLADGRTGDLTLYAYFKYVEGSGNIKATGEFDNSVANGALIAFGGCVLFALAFGVVIRAKKRRRSSADAK